MRVQKTFLDTPLTQLPGEEQTSKTTLKHLFIKISKNSKTIIFLFHREYKELRVNIKGQNTNSNEKRKQNWLAKKQLAVIY